MSIDEQRLAAIEQRCAELVRENERQADLIAEFRKRDESSGRAVKLAIRERDAERAALADLRAKAEGVLVEIEGEKVSRTLTDFTEGVNEGLEIAAENLRAALAAAPSGERRQRCEQEWVGCYAVGKVYRCKLPAGHSEAHHGELIEPQRQEATP